MNEPDMSFSDKVRAGVALVLICILIVLFFSIVFQAASPAELNRGCDGPCAAREDRMESMRED